MATTGVVVYEITIVVDSTITSDCFSLRPPPALHALLCTYCILERWDHVGLSSPHWRWYWNDERGAWIRWRDQRIELLPSHAVLVPPNVPFMTRTEREVGHLHCHFWLGVHLSGNAAHPVAVPLDRAQRASLRALTRAARQSSPDAKALPALWLSVLAHVTATLANAPYSWVTRDPDPLIDRVRQRLYDASPTAWLDNATLADEAGLSVNTLLRRFRQATGTTPKQFLLQLRIERAAGYLRGEELTIAQIAERCGFADRYHLTRCFTAHAGIGPATFRRAAARMT